MGFLAAAVPMIMSNLPAISSALSIGGTLLGASGASKSGNQASDSYLYQAQIAANNAAIQRKNATLAMDAGAYAESNKRTETGRMTASQKAAQAANGVDVGVGSPVDVRDASHAIGAMDAAMIHYNAAREAYGLRLEASNLDEQSSIYSKAAKNAKKSGKSGALATIISGASSLANNWATFKSPAAKAS